MVAESLQSSEAVCPCDCESWGHTCVRSRVDNGCECGRVRACAGERDRQTLVGRGRVRMCVCGSRVSVQE